MDTCPGGQQWIPAHRLLPQLVTVLTRFLHGWMKCFPTAVWLVEMSALQWFLTNLRPFPWADPPSTCKWGRQLTANSSYCLGDHDHARRCCPITAGCQPSSSQAGPILWHHAHSRAPWGMGLKLVSAKATSCWKLPYPLLTKPPPQPPQNMNAKSHWQSLLGDRTQPTASIKNKETRTLLFKHRLQRDLQRAYPIPF